MNTGIITLYKEYETIPYGDGYYQQISGCYSYQSLFHKNAIIKKIKKEIEKYKTNIRNEYINWLKETYPEINKNKSKNNHFMEFKNSITIEKQSIENWLVFKLKLEKISNHIHIEI